MLFRASIRSIYNFSSILIRINQIMINQQFLYLFNFISKSMDQNDDFCQFMRLTKFRKNKQFNQISKNKTSIIAYILNYLQLNDQCFVIIEDLIKQYGVAILLCFQKFYIQVSQTLHEKALLYTQKFQRIASLVKHTTKPMKFQELNFFQIFETANKGFKMKQKTQQELIFLQNLQTLRRINKQLLQISQNNFKVYYRDNPILIQQNYRQLIKIKQITGLNPFAQYYIDTMFERTVNQFNKKSNKIIQIQKKKQYIIDCQISQFNTSILQNQCTQQSTKDSLSHQKSISSFQQSLSLELSFSFVPKYLKKQKKFINFSKQPICCRTFFFQNEEILQAESQKLQFKCYRFPYNSEKIYILRRTITGFLNRNGGVILIGIKEDVKTKYREVLGEEYTQDEKQQVLKTFRKINQKIYPDVFLSNSFIKIQFVPIRHENGARQLKEPYNFEDYGYTPDQFPYKAGYFVIKITVQPGRKDQLYFYSESTEQDSQKTHQYFAFRLPNQVLRRQLSQQMLNLYRERLKENAISSKPTTNHECPQPQKGQQVNTKNIKQNQVKNKYFKKQNQQKSKEQFKINQLYKIQQEQNIIQFKRGNRHKKSKSSSSSQNKFHKNNKNSPHKNNKNSPHKHRSPQKHKRKHQQKQKQECNYQIQKRKIPLIYDIQNTIRQTLYYAVINMNEQNIVKTINKTSAKNYTTLINTKNQFTGKNLHILKVASYSFLQSFIKVKQSIQKFYSRQKVLFVGVSQRIKIQNEKTRKQVLQILKKNIVLFVQTEQIIQFYKIQTAANYCLYFRDKDIKFNVLPD